MTKIKEPRKAFFEEFEGKFVEFLNECKKYANATGDEKAIAKSVRKRLEAALQLQNLDDHYQLPKSRRFKSAVQNLDKGIDSNSAFWATLYGWLVVHEIGRIHNGNNHNSHSRSLIDEWLLGKLIHQSLLNMRPDDSKANQVVALIKLLTAQQDWFSIQTPKTKKEYHLLYNLLKDRETQSFLKVNRHEGTLWFNKESFETFAWWLFVISAIDSLININRKDETVAKEIADRFGIIHKWTKASEKSGYQVERLLELLEGKKGKKR